MADNPKIATTTPTKVPLPPIGVFWDIENCAVPKNKSAIAVVQCIREQFFDGYREAEFVCVCDAKKEICRITRELNEAQVTVVHVNSTAKNTADDKLCQLMRRFADIHGRDSAVILISGDVNFARELVDLRYRTYIKVIIIHNGFASKALLACAHLHVSYLEMTAKIPVTPENTEDQNHKPHKLIVSNLPSDKYLGKIKCRLRRISDNCGGRVLDINGDQAILSFPTYNATVRAQKRMEREDVYGNKISVNFPTNVENENGRPQVKKSQAVKQDYSSSDRGTFNLTPKSSRDAHLNKNQPGKLLRFPPPPPPSPPTKSRSSPWQEGNDCVWNGEGSGVIHHCFPGGGGGGGMLSLDGDSKLCSSAISLLQDDTITNQECPFEMYSESRVDYVESGLYPPRDQSGRKNVYKENWLENAFASRVAHRRREATPDGARRIRGIGRWPQQQRMMMPGQSQDVVPNVSRRNTPSPGPTGSMQNRMLSADQATRSGSSSSSAFTSPLFNQTSSDQPYNAITAESDATPVELTITNLDQSIDAKELKQFLHWLFREYVMVLHVSVSLSVDGNLIGGIRVPSMQAAQFAISQLHRRRIGNKRICIGVASSNNSPSLNVMKSQVLGLLSDVPGKRLPLFKFRELFERRYNTSIGTSELHRIQDLVSIQEHCSGRLVVLNADYRNTPSPASSDGSREVQEILEMARCEIHCHDENKDKGWAEKEQAPQLPNVVISLKNLATSIHSLLQSHVDSIPLNSLPTCYECEFGRLNVVAEGGVPLEHLVTCVPGVNIVKGPTGVRRLEWTENKHGERPEMRVSPPLVCQLSLFSREVVDLLKNQPGCRIAFTKFIPAYHHHFGRQCRVADYGYTRLLDLLEAMSHIVQILGDGSKRMLTLTHRAQVKRFTADLLRILKSQANKQVTLSEFPEAYAKCLGRKLGIFNFGVCYLEDMLQEISEGTVVIYRYGDDVLISIPKREQTETEVELTKMFSSEVIELLRHSPRCRIHFTKFIPAYHHHFAKQCRVKDYGFDKLIELFESIPDVVNITPADDVDDKILQLCEPIMIEVLIDQAYHILKTSGSQFVSLEKFLSAYIQLYGYSLCPEDFNAADVMELLKKIEHVIKVVDTPSGLVVTVIDRGSSLQLAVKVKRILLPVLEGQMPVDKFCETFRQMYGHDCDLNQIASSLKDVVTIKGGKTSKVIGLTPLHILGKDIVLLLYEKGGRIPMTHFDECYASRFGRRCNPSNYGHSNVASLLHALQDVVTIKGRVGKKVLVLNKNGALTWLLENVNVPPTSNTDEDSDESRRRSSCSNRVDLLSERIPSRLPSPDIQPVPVGTFHCNGDEELIKFDAPLNANVVGQEHDGHRGMSEDAPVGYVQDACHDAMYFVLQPTARPASPFYPPPSLVPPVSWLYPALPPPPLMPNQTWPSPSSMAVDNVGVPKTPTVDKEADSSENEMSTPPCVREVIAPSSAESTPTHSVTRERSKGSCIF